MPTSAKIAPVTHNFVDNQASVCKRVLRTKAAKIAFARPTPSAPATGGNEVAANREPRERELINRVASYAEERLASGRKKASWFGWFGRMLRGEKGLLRRLREVARTWPPLERAVFECCCIQGVSMQDLVLATGCTARVLHAHLRNIQFQLRQEIVRQVLLEPRPRDHLKRNATTEPSGKRGLMVRETPA